MSNKKHYVAEYATDKINSVKENSFMVSWIKGKIINTIKTTLDGYNPIEGFSKTIQRENIHNIIELFKMVGGVK